MSPETLNIILLAVVLIFVVNGFFQGLIHMLGSLLGLIVGVFWGSRYDTALGAWFANLTGWDKNVMVVVAFVVIILVTTRVFGIVVHILENTFHIMKLPLVGMANRFAGALFGFFEGILVTGMTLIVIGSLPFLNFGELIGASALSGSLMAAAKILLPLLPKSIADLYKI